VVAVTGNVHRGRESLEEGTLSPESNLGRSLLAGFCQQYQPDFVLHGTSDRSFLDKQLHSDLQLTLKVSILILHYINSYTHYRYIQIFHSVVYWCPHNHLVFRVADAIS